jgi:hypothetical protein
MSEVLSEPWLDDLDLEAMTRENATYHVATGDRPRRMTLATEKKISCRGYGQEPDTPTYNIP